MRDDESIRIHAIARRTRQPCALRTSQGNTVVKLSARLGVAVLVVHSLLPLSASAQSQLTYTTSWIGNSFGFGDGKWMQQDIQAISVGADGTVYTNAPWDESGSEIAAYRGGDKIAVAGSTHGWGAAGGDALATNHTYLYAAMSIGNESNGLVGADYPPANQTWYGITRRTLANLANGAPFNGGIGNSANARRTVFSSERGDNGHRCGYPRDGRYRY
jgi:hypothetical protein